MFKYLFLILSLTFLSACTRTMDANYQSAGLNLSNNILENKKVAVHEFEDLRAWIDATDKKSHSFIAQQGMWKFGLSYQGTDYQSVSFILQDIFVNELKSVSADAFKFQDKAEFDYELKGKIINFEFENETGFVTVTSKRHVSLQLSLNDAQGNAVLYNEIFNEVARENEGMGVLHTTNADKLLQNQLKKTITNAIEKFNVEIAKQGIDNVTVSLNGVKIKNMANQKTITGYVANL